jgi:hypothetical protein
MGIAEHDEQPLLSVSVTTSRGCLRDRTPVASGQVSCT